MPALPPVPKVIRVDYKFHIGEDLGALVREFFQYTGAGPDNAGCVALAGTIIASAAANLIPLMDPHRNLEEVIITDLSSPTGATGSLSSSNPGSRAGDFLPASTCLLQSFEIARRYRGGHPRSYWPFGVFDDLDDSQTWTTVFTGECETALAGHFTAWSSALPPGMTTVVPVNVSYYEGFTVHTGVTGRARNVSTVRPLGPLVDQINSFVIRVGVAQIRRRLLGLA